MKNKCSLWAMILVFTLLLLGAPVEAKQKKVLIFYAKIGMGHLAAARGIERDLAARYPDTQVVLKDVLDFMNPQMSAMTTKVYDFSTKLFPWLFDESFREYMAIGRETDSMGDMPLGKTYKPEKFYEYIEAEAPDLILTTYHNAAETLIHLRDQGKLQKTPIAWVHTDLVDETYFAKIALQMDMAFVGTKSMELSWKDRGVPADRVLGTGMPLNPRVFEAKDFAKLKLFREQKGIHSQGKVVLLIGGLNGVGDYPKMVKSLADSFNGEPLQVIAVCGINKTHVKNLSKLKPTLPSNVNLQITEFIPQDELFQYMQVADAIISKTGGLTPMELFYQSKPIVLLDINGGQEKYNADTYQKLGLAEVITDQEQVGNEIKKLLSEPARASALVQEQNKFCNESCPSKIADWMMSDPSVKPRAKILLKTTPDYQPPERWIWKCSRILRKNL